MGIRIAVGKPAQDGFRELVTGHQEPEDKFLTSVYPLPTILPVCLSNAVHHHRVQQHPDHLKRFRITLFYDADTRKSEPTWDFLACDCGAERREIHSEIRTSHL